VGKSSRSATAPRLDRTFFDRPTVAVARDLLGATLRVGGRAVRIVETEAYVASDPANHAFRGPTARNRSMFGPPGTLYIYRIHQVVCANLVTCRGEAVLLRAGEPLTEGLENSSGPGRLCRALGIRLTDDGTSAVSDPRIRVEQTRGVRTRIVSGPRVGIRRAKRRRLRFALAGNPWVSPPRLPARAIQRAQAPPGAGGRR
jgi:DNA-3-methyladenine glycosylase